MNSKVSIIGGGLAGCEAAYQLARRGVSVTLYDIKPNGFTPAHTDKNLCELVCSNSLKSDMLTNACGLLKQEMRLLDSLVIRCADKTRVPAGGALAVNRELFAQAVTDVLKGEKNISIVSKELEQPEANEINIIATGPLTTEKLSRYICTLTGGENLFFFDAAAPIIDGSTIDMESAFVCDRYGRGSGDYLNCPLEKEEYYAFVKALTEAQTAPLKDFEKDGRVFEACMPVEVMAKRGIDSLRFGPLKPVGLTDKNGKKPFAVVQLRKENLEGSFYNIVGFQTNLKFGEQKRVFSMIPALKNAEFVKYGVMHRNTYINSPLVLNAAFGLKADSNIFFAGQITGVEGYVESASSGLTCALNVYRKLCGKPFLDFTRKTVTGALAGYISSPCSKFQPMNANFAILEPLKVNIRDKTERYSAFAARSLKEIERIKEENEL